MNTVTKMLAFAAAAAVLCGAAKADYASDCREAIKRNRGTMYYYEGQDSFFWPSHVPFSVDHYPRVGYPSRGLDSILDMPAHVDTLVYRPIGAFALLSTNPKIVKSADAITWQRDPKSTMWGRTANHIPDFHRAGTDPLAEAVKWARRNKREIIACLPVNSVQHNDYKQDKNPPPQAPYLWDNLYTPPFKLKNPGFLMGGKDAKLPDSKIKDPKKNPPYAHWQCVDYGREEVRNKFAAVAKEVAEGYDLDGIMIDFLEYPAIFSSVAWGGTASGKECDSLTAMMWQIRAAMEAGGKKRGRPCLLSVRVPDSVQYCKDIGIDIQAWMEKNEKGVRLLDYVVVGGHFQLNPWSVFGDVAKKAGVPFYVCMDNSRIWVGNDSSYPNDDELIPRQSPEGFRALVMDALAGGASGCMWHNPYHWYRFSNNCVVGSDKAKHIHANKRYYVTYFNSSSAGAFLKDGRKYMTIQHLASGSPYELKKGPAKYTVNMWDDFDALRRANKGVPRVELITETSIPSGMDVEVTFNTKKVTLIKKQAGHQYFEVPFAAVKTGANEVVVKETGRNKRGQTAKLGNIAVDVIYDAQAEKKEGK